MFRGSVVAIVTPFDEKGEVDLKALESLVRFHLEEGTDAIVCLGTTGEAATLSPTEKSLIIKTVVKTVKGKIPVVVGTGSYDTRAAFEQTREAKELGADACLVILPYCTRPGFSGCLAHFEKIAEAELPMIVYHHPSRTGVKLSPKELGELCRVPHVFAIKEASGDINCVMELRQHTDKLVFSGDDNMTLPIVCAGGAGVISIVANVIPKQWRAFVHTCLKKDFDGGLALADKYYALCRSLVLETNPQGVKYALSLVGKIAPSLRLPLVEPLAGTKREISQAMEDLGLFSGTQFFMHAQLKLPEAEKISI